MKKNSSQYNGMMADMFLGKSYEYVIFDDLEELEKETKPSRMKPSKMYSKHKSYDNDDFNFKNPKKAYH